MRIVELKTDKKQVLDLLLLADEQESMIDRYLERGTLYALEDGGIQAVCVVTDEGGRTAEIKNLAVRPERQRTGLGRRMIRPEPEHGQRFVSGSRLSAAQAGGCALLQMPEFSAVRRVFHQVQLPQVQRRHIRHEIAVGIPCIPLHRLGRCGTVIPGLHHGLHS